MIYEYDFVTPDLLQCDECMIMPMPVLAFSTLVFTCVFDFHNDICILEIASPIQPRSYSGHEADVA